MLQWARASGCPWDEYTCLGAAEGGHLEVLQWARTNGCPWDKWTCSMAARGGHLKMLQWARANGCPWDEKTYPSAAARARSRRCGGRARTAARGTIGRAISRRDTGIPSCGTVRARTDVRGEYDPNEHAVTRVTLRFRGFE